MVVIKSRKIERRGEGKGKKRNNTDSIILYNFAIKIVSLDTNVIYEYI